MLVRALFISASLWLSFLPSSYAASCTGGGVKPAWVESPELITDEYFSAAGVSDNLNLSLSERISTAKQNAQKNLSESIEVSVKNSLVLEQSSRTSAGQELTDASLLSITKTSTSASLRNVEVIATWEDPRSCALWLRARVSKKHVEQGKREGLAHILYAMLNEHLSLVQNDSASMSARLSALDAATEVLPRIALEFVPEASSMDFYKQLLGRLKKDLLQQRNDLDQARAGLNSADLLVNKAAGQNNENEKSKSLGAAATAYKSLLAKHGNGLLPVFESGDILFRLGEVEELRGSSCGAKNYYQQAADSRQINDRHEIARKKAETLMCSADDMEKTLWRQYFEGRSTTIICYFNTKSDRGVWNKACDGLSNVVRQLGADVNVRGKELSAAQLADIRDGRIPMNLGESGKLVLGVFALGEMKRRATHNSGGRDNEYQFDGGMTTFLIDNGSSVFADRFQGTTGWNPISQQMVMDVLGINVVKRWRDKFSKFLRHELSS